MMGPCGCVVEARPSVEILDSENDIDTIDMTRRVERSLFMAFASVSRLENSSKYGQVVSMKIQTCGQSHG